MKASRACLDESRLADRYTRSSALILTHQYINLNEVLGRVQGVDQQLRVMIASGQWLSLCHTKDQCTLLTDDAGVVSASSDSCAESLKGCLELLVKDGV